MNWVEDTCGGCAGQRWHDVHVADHSMGVGMGHLL